jgi:hypothetical protein
MVRQKKKKQFVPMTNDHTFVGCLRFAEFWLGLSRVGAPCSHERILLGRWRGLLGVQARNAHGQNEKEEPQGYAVCHSQ